MGNVGLVKLQEMQYYAFSSGNVSELARIRKIASLKGVDLGSG